MTCVVTDNCLGCKFTACVAACPVDCFCEDERMVYVDPSHCIGCKACVNECPVHALYMDYELPAHLAHWVKINADKVESGEALPITRRKPPLPGAEARMKALGFKPRE